MDREHAEVLNPREERTPAVRSRLLSVVVERMRTGIGPRGIQNMNGTPQHQQPNLPVPQAGVLASEQVRQQQQQQRDDDWAQPPPHPSDRRALTPITERSTRDSNSWDTNPNPPPVHRPGISTANGSPLQPDRIQKQQSETSQDLPKLQTDAESSTFLGEAIATSPTSHIPLHEFGIGRADSAGSLGSKPDHPQSTQKPISLSRPDSKLDTHTSTDPVRPTGGSIGSPLRSPEKEVVVPMPPLPHSHQPIPPVQSTFSDVPKTPPRNPDRLAPTPPVRKDLGGGSGSPAPSFSSRLQGVIQRKEGGSPSDSFNVATKAQTPEPTLLSQTNPHPNSPTFSPTPTTANSPPTLTHTHTTTTTSTSKSEYSGYSNGSKPGPPQHAQGSFSSPDHEGVKSLRQVNGGSGDGYDLMKEAGALYYMQEVQGAAVLQPPKSVGRGQNTLMNSRGQSESDNDENGRKPSTQYAPRPLPQQTQSQSQRLPPEPSALQVRRPSAQAKVLSVPPPPPLPVSLPQHPSQPSLCSPQNQHQNHDYAQGREPQPILAPQPQQPVTSSFNPVNTIEGDVRSPNLYSPGGDTNNASSAVDSRRTPVIGHSGGQGGGSRPGLGSRPSGARDLVQKQRAGTSDSVSSQSRHNGEPQPRHPLPSHPEPPPEQPSQSSYSTYTQPSRHQDQNFTQTIDPTDRYPVSMANVDRRQHYDDNSDALAALTFLERDEANAIPNPPPLLRKAGPTSEPKARTYDTPPVHVTPSESGDDVSQDSGSYEGKYKSSFAPSKQATQRLAKTQAQQAAHQAAAHRPGKSGGANGKGKRRVRQGGWAESSEEEEEEDEDDEDVDSDGDPVPQMRGQGHGIGLGKLSAQGSPYGSSTDLNQPGQGKPQRNLPRPPSPGRGYGRSPLTFFFS